jgi:hypothetical protein
MKLIKRKAFINVSPNNVLICENKLVKYYEEFNIHRIKKIGNNQLLDCYLKIYFEFEKGDIGFLSLGKEDAEKDRYIYNKFIWYIK